MDPRLLTYYEQELQHVRGMGAEFAREFPKIARRLALEEFDCHDPYVERLLEGFAFMAARVQLRLDADFPRFTQHLFEIVYPHYLAPTPSMAVVQLGLGGDQGALTSGFRVERQTALRARLGRHADCEFRTAHNVTLWPIELTQASYSTLTADLGTTQLSGLPAARAALSLRLRTTGGMAFSQLPISQLPVFLCGSGEVPTRLYEALLSHGVGVVARTPGRPIQWQTIVRNEAPLRAHGFDDEQALLPFGPRSFSGYRLLQEYFAFPARFLFVELAGLETALRACPRSELELVVLLKERDRALEGSVDRANFQLFCTPAINLFARTADRIHISDRQSHYHVVPDHSRPMNLEVHSVQEVLGYARRAEPELEFLPLYAARDLLQHGSQNAYYTIERRPRRLSSKQRQRGRRSSYIGTETYVSLVDSTGAQLNPQLRQLGVSTLCTNRDLPLHIPPGQPFTLQSGGPVQDVQCVAGPTPPYPSPVFGNVAWRLISHLSLNHTSLTDTPGEGAAALRQLLALYSDVSDASVAKQIEGLRSVASQPVTRPLPLPGPVTFGRGLEITLSCDEAAFEGSGAFLLGAVLERFFAKYVTLNSFTETVLRTLQRGEVKRWSSRAGLQPDL